VFGGSNAVSRIMSLLPVPKHKNAAAPAVNRKNGVGILLISEPGANHAPLRMKLVVSCEL